jgi:hypothetical protein
MSIPQVTEATEYAEKLIDKSLTLSETAQAAALNVFRKAAETVESVVPGAQSAVAKIDLTDVRQLVDGAFATAERVLSRQQSYVSELLSVLAAPSKPPSNAKAAKAA